MDVATRKKCPLKSPQRLQIDDPQNLRFTLKKQCVFFNKSRLQLIKNQTVPPYWDGAFQCFSVIVIADINDFHCFCLNDVHVFSLIVSVRP